MAKEISLASLTPEQKKALMQELEEEQKIKNKKQAEERAKYKEMVDTSVRELFPSLKEASKMLALIKTKIISELQTLVKIKAELYDKEENQTSHTFSTSDGYITITIGYNILDGWDDTAETGIAKVNDYLQSLISDKKSKALVETIMKLLSKDSKGNLKASRVLQLKQIAEKSEDKSFIDAIQIIQEAYRPVRSRDYVRCEYKNDAGVKISLPLTITEVDKIEAEQAEEKQN